MNKASLILIALCVSACGGKASDEPREETVGAEIASGYNQQMQKASEVELQLEASKRDLDAAIRESTQGSTDP